jgi:eukaryotic-like serine/threonine-protein kinase
MTPRPFGSYELLQRIAVSGISELWHARPREGRSRGREVLIQRLYPAVAEEPEQLALFQQGAKLSAHLHHPNIVRFYEFGEVQSSHYIAREFVHGGTLAMVLRQAQKTQTALSPALGLRIGASICEGLHHAHTRTDHLGHPLKLVHRELFPRHILLGFDGRVKLIGFGGSLITDYLFESRGGLSHRAFESMAPEQAGGEEQDPRTDVFCTGLVVYELLTGVRPFRRKDQLEAIRAVRECRISPPSEVARVPSVLDPVVMRALAREKEDRYPDAHEFQLALEGALLTCRWEVDAGHLATMVKKLFPQESGAA